MPTDGPPTGEPATEGSPGRRFDALRIVAEPGLPAAVAGHCEGGIDRSLEERALQFRGVTVAHDTTLQMTPQDDLATGIAVDAVDESEAVVFVTESPRVLGKRVVSVEIDHERSAAVLSSPALGMLPGRSLVPTIAAIVDRMSGGPDVGNSSGRHGGIWEASGDGSTEFLFHRGLLSRSRVVLGMVRGNRPWRLIPTLTGLTAAAAAAASFGVFFSSIWAMANALSPWRLAAISVLSIVLASTWLIVNNRLWEHGGDKTAWRVHTYNTVTACTVVLSAVVLYVGLFLATFVASLFVIDSEFMASQLGHSVGLDSYVVLAWLATSMGMFAGGLGSSADSYDDVLRATYGYRERMRRQHAHAARDDDGTS